MIDQPHATDARDTCPDREKHTPEPDPEDHRAWNSWAERMSQTHRQTRCPTCDLWVIWVPKKAVQ